MTLECFVAFIVESRTSLQDVDQGSRMPSRFQCPRRRQRVTTTVHQMVAKGGWSGWIVPLLLVVAAAAGCGAPANSLAADSTFVRVICHGVHKLSMTELTVDCRQDSTLADTGNLLIPAYTAGRASRAEFALEAKAAGGSTRDLGYNGGQAEALLKSALSLPPSRPERLPLVLVFRVQYDFAGMGEARLNARLWSAPRNLDPRDERYHLENMVRIAAVHSGFRGATLVETEAQGDHQVPATGAIPSRGELELRLMHWLAPGDQSVSFRAELQAYSLPNLGSLEQHTYAAVGASGQLHAISPCAELFEADRETLKVRRPANRGPDRFAQSAQCP